MRSGILFADAAILGEPNYCLGGLLGRKNSHVLGSFSKQFKWLMRKLLRGAAPPVGGHLSTQGRRPRPPACESTRALQLVNGNQVHDLQTLVHARSACHTQGRGRRVGPNAALASRRRAAARTGF